MRKLFILAVFSFLLMYSCTKDVEGLNPENTKQIEVSTDENQSMDHDSNDSTISNSNNGNNPDDSDTTTTSIDTNTTDTTEVVELCLYISPADNFSWDDCLWDRDDVTVSYHLNGQVFTATANSSNYNTAIACGEITNYNIQSCSGEIESYYGDSTPCNGCDDITLELR